jgi:hypothetical protein
MDGTLALLKPGEADCCRRYLELGVQGGWITEDERAAWMPPHRGLGAVLPR